MKAVHKAVRIQVEMCIVSSITIPGLHFKSGSAVMLVEMFTEARLVNTFCEQTRKQTGVDMQLMYFPTHVFFCRL